MIRSHHLTDSLSGGSALIFFNPKNHCGISVGHALDGGGQLRPELHGKCSVISLTQIDLISGWIREREHYVSRTCTVILPKPCAISLIGLVFPIRQRRWTARLTEFHMSSRVTEKLGRAGAWSRLSDTRGISHSRIEHSCSRCFMKTSWPGTILVQESWEANCPLARVNTVRSGSDENGNHFRTGRL